MADLYCKAGEVVTCESGHPVGEFVRDVVRGERQTDDQFVLLDGTSPKPGDLLPKCLICGAEAFRGMTLTGSIAHFATDGWRSHG